MQTTSLKARIIEEIDLIPEDKLEQIYQMIHLFRLGLERLREVTYQQSQTEMSETQTERLEEAHPKTRNGFLLFPHRPDTLPVTLELVNELR